MTVAIVLESETFVGPDLRWPLRLAALFGGEVVLILRDAERMPPGEVALDRVPDEGEPGAKLVAGIHAALDEYVGSERWIVAPAEPGREKPPADVDGVLTARLRIVPASELVDVTLSLLCHPRSDLIQLVVSTDTVVKSDSWAAASSEFMSRSAARIVFVAPGRRQESGEIVVATARGPHAATAVRQASRLAKSESRELTALYTEADIGPDAPAVGRRILDRCMRGALGDHAVGIARRVEVSNDPAKGILRAVEDSNVELLVLGTSRLGALGQRRGGVPVRVLRGTNEPTIIGARAAVPLRSRARQWTDQRLQQIVPQLERTDRTSLVERVQSNAQWNFDFVLLMGLSTMIAALGLLDDSPAVIIGAMLIAPLMTPLLGLGLGLAQGNAILARLTLKAAGLGFVTAFVLAVLVGVVAREFHESTSEMAARDWPQLLDLVIAFVGGLAAAYASGRPGLLAALPGVAIAAALLPPIATAGLAVSILDFDLAAGAMLLFLVNMVAIVLAAAVSLWAVGIRSVGRATRTTRIVGTAVIVSAVVMAVGFTLAPPRLAPPTELVEAVETALPLESRLRRIRLRKEAAGWVVQIDLGGTRAPGPGVVDALHALADEHLGESAGVRLTFRYEVVIR